MAVRIFGIWIVLLLASHATSSAARDFVNTTEGFAGATISSSITAMDSASTAPDSEETAVDSSATSETTDIDTDTVDEDTWITEADDNKATELTYLVPSLKGTGYSVAPGKRQFYRRIAFSPGVGRLGDEEFFALRGTFNPNSWLGYEISFGHNPASSLHALLHTFNVILRYPFPWRAQPYATVGYGMLTVFPGKAINADPVTKNAITAGGGLELFIRDDVSLRGELRSANVIGQELGKDGNVTYSYREFTIGFAFYRSLGR
jgi:hypothetical protein